MSKHLKLSPHQLLSSSPRVLLQNLHLLDLDEEIDFPAKSLDTFSFKEELGNQKHRLYCAEWILYKLFEIWNREPEKVFHYAAALPSG